MSEMYFDDYGKKLVGVHPKEACWRKHCPIHNPSWHNLRHMKQSWRSDKGFFERICEHGVGHPDPDEILNDDRMLAMHGCDGCCTKDE